jgi:hypothetical protein
MLRKIYLFLLVFGFGAMTKAQSGFSHEVGAFVGPVLFQSDFGERYNFDTNIGNNGFGVGLVHYMNFSYTAECNCYKPETYFNDHFKVRTEISYTRSKLSHYGQWADKQNAGGAQLRAMKGEANVFNVGMQLEYFPLSIRDFTATIGSWAPYGALGGHFNLYSPKVYSELGNLGDPAITPTKYIDGFSNDSGSTFSLVGGVGTRYKLAELSDLFVEVRWSYYFSNWIDGLNPNPEIYKENKVNDWNLWLNLGYIYYLD